MGFRTEPLPKPGVRVRTLYTDRIMVIEAEREELVSVVKCRIRQKLGDSDDFCLLFAGTELADSCSLAFYKIPTATGATLHLLKRRHSKPTSSCFGDVGSLIDR